MKQLIECVPNFSEGRNLSVINAIKNEIETTKGVYLLHIDIGYDANRTVMTFVGEPKSVVKAAFKAIQKAAQIIDMSNHNGAHPRIGSTDVCPLIPISNISLETTNLLAHDLAKKVGYNLNIPVYMYEYSARKPQRKNLAYIRKGEYEQIPKKITSPEWTPDYGPAKFNPKTGNTVIGVRNFLIAYNVNLNTKDVSIAKTIAKNIRESGYVKNGKSIPGKLQKVKAIGWYMDAFKCAQVSTNIIDFKTTSLPLVFETIQEEAQKHGIHVTGSELIGMIPEACWRDMLQFYNTTEENVIKKLGLDQLKPFDLDKKIIERRLTQLQAANEPLS